MSNFSLIEDTHNFIRKMDLENEQIEKQISDLLGQNIFSTLETPPEAKQNLHQINFLESRLAAAESKISSLNETIAEKDQTIAELQKSKPSPSANYRKKELELESKVSDLEKKLTEERKAMQRLQQLNKELMAKVKEISIKQPVFRPEEDKRNLQTELNRANNLLKTKDAQILKLKKNYDELVESCKEFEGKSEDLYNWNKNLEETIRDLCDKAE